MTIIYIKINLCIKKHLIDDLQKYGNLKLAIKNLEDIEKDLKSKKKTQEQTNEKREIDTIKKTRNKI